MVNKSERYIQPKNVNEAMTLVQKLFNEYRNAPLTNELLRYHQNLVNRLQTDIHQAAVQENNKKQLQQLDSMTQIMKSWSIIRLTGRPFPGKMKNFKMDTNDHLKYKRKVHKVSGNHNYRSSRH